MTKKVIFVGGTSYSGSTFFHLTLANDPKGFGVGEVKHLFRPTKEKHISPTWLCGCGDPDCQLWSRVKQKGEKHLYETLFELHPEVDFIVDASKNVVWIDDQVNRLAKQGIEARHVVIWKTLLEYAHSLQKRNRLHEDGGARLANWPRYHQNYYSFIETFRTVKYAEYVHEQAAVLQAVCRYLDIPYFEGKERFWEKIHHVLGGNLSSRIHLYSKGSERYNDVQRRAKESQGELGAAHRQVYYEEPGTAALEAHVATLYQKDKDIALIEKMLLSHDVRNSEFIPQDRAELELGAIDVQMRRLRQFRRDHLSKIRLG